ncbi:hypothetical protein [Ferroacidibacillus organovorans]|uniref:ApeA N-terminal domain-containing protein n=1 Tax=Ferroacidibacillus organovorans TaxID=1765683 RepID=A0A853K7Z3_9BACL|nr:hypothetical protein [Ferroacidibacillus organovorans]KYP79233.1 hypothetical protein AYJ22_15335 [Ferroacidibacillus organovorans]OAG86830.1 hypothetical protein AYW79_14820 [Ferroacidibacillus organovorans]
MFAQNDKPGDILLRDWIDYIHNKAGQEQWITVYSSNRGEWGATYFFCALIPNLMVEDSLNNESWDLHFDRGRPGCTQYHDLDGTDTVKYHRFGHDNGVEPLIHCRDFYGMRKDYVEVSEEFRLFHNLYYDKANSKFIQISESGTEEDVILVEDDRVRIKLKPLKQFLSIKDMHLAIFFSIDRHSDRTLSELGLTEERRTVREGNILYFYFVGEQKFSISDDKPMFSRIEGKKLISGMAKEKSGIWPYEDEDEFENFIIDVDENGDPQSYTCDPDELANYFGANPDAPNYLTPVFFRRDVLTKYYSKPDIYSVDDGYLRCGGLWGLRLDNNHQTHVIVYLGDLGRDLPAAERVYWKSYNIPPDGKISDVNWKRSLLDEFTDPEKADLVFKYQFNILQERWQGKFGWVLFRPLSEEDQHNFKTLRIPVSDDQSEFDQQSMSLTKVLVDSLNEEEIKEQIQGAVPRDTKGISKLSLWLQEQGCHDAEPHIKFLRSLQDLRNGAGHRKGDSYARGAAYFSIGEKPLAVVFEGILECATNFLMYLQNRILQEQK